MQLQLDTIQTSLKGRFLYSTSMNMTQRYTFPIAWNKYSPES